MFCPYLKDNMTTEEYLGSLLIENALKPEAFVSENLHLNFTSNQLEVKKLRITYYDGQCFSVTLPKNVTDGMNKLRSYIRFNET